MGAVRVVVALVIAGFALAAEPAHAQDRVVPGPGAASRDRRPGYSRSHAYHFGFDRGWRDGSESGHRDGRRRRLINDWPKGEARSAGRGYGLWMGARNDYLAGYREGYAAGYRRAYAAARPAPRDRPVPPDGRSLFRPLP